MGSRTLSLYAFALVFAVAGAAGLAPGRPFQEVILRDGDHVSGSIHGGMGKSFEGLDIPRTTSAWTEARARTLS